MLSNWPNLAVVLLKPDSVRDNIQRSILVDLCTGAPSMKVVLKKDWLIPECMIPHMYPDWIYKREFPAMKRNLLQGFSEFYLVTGEQTIYQELIKTKGKMNKGGIRLKYRQHSIEEWIEMGYSGERLDDKIAENRIHTTDTFEECMVMCNLALARHEKVLIVNEYPTVKQFLL